VLLALPGSEGQRVTSSGELIGSVVTAQAAPSTGSPLPVAGQVAVDIKDSFAEMMRQSSPINAVKTETTTSVPNETAALASLKQVKTQPTSGRVGDKAPAYAKSNVTAEGASAKSEAARLTKSKAVATENGTPNAAALVAPITSTTPTKGNVNTVLVAVSSSIIEKSPMENREKAKTAAGVKTSVHSEGKASENPTVSTASDGGGNIVATAPNVAVESTIPGGNIPIATQSSAAMSSLTTPAADGKSMKAKTSQMASAATAEPATTSSVSFADAAAVANGSPGAVSPGTSSGIVVSAVIQGGVEQTASASLTQVHTAQAQGANLLPVVSAPHSAQAGSVAIHNQTSGTSDLTVSTYDAGKPNQLEVGLQGGGFGSLKVRAELTSAGEVNAYLRGSSMDSTGLLQMQAPKIEAYLGTQDVAVRSVQVETTQTHSLSAGLGGDGGATEDGRASQQQSGRSSRQSDAGADVLTSTEASNEAVMPAQMVARQSGIAMTETGNWLSVRA